MATRPNPYVKKDPGDIMLAADWNEMQVQARESLAGHRHTGGADAEPITRAGIAPNAVDGTRIDPQADVALKSLKINGRGVLDEIDGLLAQVKGMGSRLQVSGAARLGGAVEVGGTLAVAGVSTLGGGLVLTNGTGRTALDVGIGLLSGAANDYQKAQVALTGGGLVTWSAVAGAAGILKWSNRFLSISVERPKTLLSGHINIYFPAEATLVKSWDGTQRWSADGVQLNDWEALFAVHEVGGDQSKVSFQIANFQSPTAFHAPGNWLLVAVVNGDDRTVKLGTGAVVASTSSYAATFGSSLPRGAIILWNGDVAPSGWALCDGQNGTPDLRGRFVLGAGNGAGLSGRRRGDTGGVERHALSINEMPSHTHGVNDPTHSHAWTASRQMAGTDDNNNTSEFSRGDRGGSDPVNKGTTGSATGISLQAAGGSQAHENMPPYYVLAYIMKL